MTNALPKPVAKAISLYRKSHTTLWAMGDQALVSASNFFTTIILVRALGLEKFGEFTFAWLILLFFKGLHMAMIASPLLSIGPKQEGADRPAYLGAALLHQIAFTVAAFGIAALATMVTDAANVTNGLAALGIALGAATFADLTQDFVRRYFYIRSQVLMVFLSDLVSYGSRIVVLVIVFDVLGSFGIDWLSGVTNYFHVAPTSANALWIMFWCGMAGAVIGILRFERVRFERLAMITMTRRHWDFSKWLSVRAIVRWFAGQFMVMTAGVVLGEAAMGAIRAVQSLTQPIQTFMQALTNTATVQAAKMYHKSGVSSLGLYLFKLAAFGLLFVGSISLGAVIFSDPIVLALYGEELAPYSHLVAWFAGIYILLFLVFVAETGLKATEFTRPIFWVVLVEAAYSLSCSYLIATNFGLEGIMWGLLGTAIIPAVMMGFFLFRRLSEVKKDETQQTEGLAEQPSPS